MKLKIKVKLIGNTKPLQIIDKGDWIDLCARETTSLKGPQVLSTRRKDKPADIVDRRSVKFDYALINLGVAMELPAGYEALVAPRSSLPSKLGIELSNSIGVIDNSYKGDSDEWKFYARAMRDTTIEAGTRIAQFRVVLSQKATIWQRIKWLFTSGIDIVYVDSLGNKNRGGIGSTGM